MSLDYAAGIRICGHSSRRCDTWSHIAVMFVFLCAPDCVAADLHLNVRTRQRISAVRHQLWPVNGFLRACLHERCKRDGAWQRIRNRLHRCPTPMMIVFWSSRSGEVFGRLMTSVEKEVKRKRGDRQEKEVTSMIGNSQGETEIPRDLAEGVLPTGKAFA
jgi:hypothetical protein